MKKIIGVVALATSLFASSAEAATYYVSANSPAAGDGSAANPFQTLDSALGISLNPGDEIRVGKGTYNLAGTVTIPDGVTVRGAYPGYGDAGTWTTASMAVTATTINVPGCSVFNMNAKTLLEKVTLDKNAVCDWAIYLNGTGATVRGSRLLTSGHGVNAAAAGVTLETSTLGMRNNYNAVSSSCGSNYQVTVKNNTIYSEAEGSDLDPFYFRFQCGARALVQGNKIHVYDDNWQDLFNDDGRLHLVQNLIENISPYLYGYAFNGSDNYEYIVESNNITGFYSAFYDYGYPYDYPRHFRNNLVFRTGGDQYGVVYPEYYPYSQVYLTGNCIEPWGGSVMYLYSWDGWEGFPTSGAAADEMQPGYISGTQITGPISNKLGYGCGSKGMAGTPIVSKPVARAGSDTDSFSQLYDDRFGDSSGFPGDVIYLWGDDSVNYAGGDVTYTWSKISGPAGFKFYSTVGTVTTSNTTTISGDSVTAFTTAPGVYKLRLVVRSTHAGAVNSDPFDFDVTIQDNIKVLRANGTQRGAWKTFQYALMNAVTGDTIVFPAGLYQFDGTDSTDIIGKQGITIKGAGSGAGGTRMRISCQDLFYVEYSKNIRFEDFAYVDESGCGYYGFDLDQSTGIVIDQVASDMAYSYDSNYLVYANDADVTLSNGTFRWFYNVFEMGGCGKINITANQFGETDNTVFYSGWNQDCGYDTVSITNNNFNLNQTSDYVIDIEGFYGNIQPVTITGNTFDNPSYESLYLYYIYYVPTVVANNTFYADRRWLWRDDYTIYIDYSTVNIKNNLLWGNGSSAIYVESEDGWGEVAVENNVIAYVQDGFGIENYNQPCPNDCETPTTWARGNVIYGTSYGPYYNVDVRDGNVYQDPGYVNADAGNFALTASSPLNGMTAGTGLALPASPANVQAEGLDNGTVRVTFDEVAGATGYTLYWGASAGTYAQNKDLSLERVADVTGLAAMPYYFAVSARNAKGEGKKSTAVIAAPKSGTTQTEPVIDGIEPTVVTAGKETEVIVTGADFAEGAKVFVGSTEIEVLERIDGSTLKARMAKSVKGGIYPVIVVNPDLGRGALHQALTVRSTGDPVDDAGCATGGNASLALALIPLALLALRRRSAN